MAKAFRGSSAGIASRAVLGAILISLVSASAAAAETASMEDHVSAVVQINTHINPEGRTIQGLGREREGSGILIDSDGLVLTIGYLMVEAYAAEVVANNGRTVPANVIGYDHESGFGLLRTITPLKLKPMPLGKSAEIKEGDPVLIASFGGPGMVAGAYVVAKREFAGSWEYLLDEALFTAPPHPAWSGAALISREGKLVGVGSLIVGDAGHQARRRDRRCQWRAAQNLGRFLPQGLGAGQRWCHHCARCAARKPGAPNRRQIDEPARSSEAEIDVLTAL